MSIECKTDFSGQDMEKELVPETESFSSLDSRTTISGCEEENHDVLADSDKPPDEIFDDSISDKIKIDEINLSNGDDTSDHEDRDSKQGEISKIIPEEPKTESEEIVEVFTPRRTGRKRKLNCLSPEYLEMRRYVKSGDVQALRDYLDKYSNISRELVNMKDSEGSTPLNEIAGKTAQFVEIAKVLIEHDVDVNESDELGHTPLHNAIIYYPATHGMVELLLNNGADVERKNIGGITPFDMSDDVSLKSFLSENSSSGATANVLSDWLSTPSKTAISKLAASKMNCKYPTLPESPGGILKRKAKMCVINDQNSNRGTKRRRSSLEDPDLNDSDLAAVVSSKRIRFVPLDSTGGSIDLPEFSDDDD